MLLPVTLSPLATLTVAVDGIIMTTQKQRIAISVIVNLHNHSFCADFVQRQDSHRRLRQRDPLVELT